MPEKALGTAKEPELSCVRLFADVPCWISVQNRAFEIIEANRKLIEDFGDHRGEHCYAIYKGRAGPCPECPVERTFGDGKEHTSQEIVFDRHGLPHDVVVNTGPLRNRGGEIEAVMKLYTDISAEKELENRLHDSLVRLHNLLDNAPCFISVQDRRFRILESNRRFNESFGEGTGEHCYEVYKQRRERCARCPVAETFEDGEVHTSEEVVVDNRSRQVHVLVYAAPIRDASGAITSVMEMSTDITEIRTLQNKLAMLGQLVGGIAHSVKNVLEGLRGGVYIVNLGFRNHNEEDIRAGWSMVERNVGRLSALIMDMLYCARDRSPRKLPVPVSGIAREVIALFAPGAKELGIHLEMGAADDVQVPGEPKDIHALIANLVTNAMDACKTDPREHSPHRVIVRILAEPRTAVIEVEDDGVGMDAGTRSALFHGLVSTKGAAGTGLGLLVSHKVATEHGGTISVRSEPGQGSTFTVHLPRDGGV